jgi:hypothetical protein
MSSGRSLIVYVIAFWWLIVNYVNIYTGYDRRPEYNSHQSGNRGINLVVITENSGLVTTRAIKRLGHENQTNSDWCRVRRTYDLLFHNGFGRIGAIAVH